MKKIIIAVLLSMVIFKVHAKLEFLYARAGQMVQESRVPYTGVLSDPSKVATSLSEECQPGGVFYTKFII